MLQRILSKEEAQYFLQMLEETQQRPHEVLFAAGVFCGAEWSALSILASKQQMHLFDFVDTNVLNAVHKVAAEE